MERQNEGFNIKQKEELRFVDNFRNKKVGNSEAAKRPSEHFLSEKSKVMKEGANSAPVPPENFA